MTLAATSIKTAPGNRATASKRAIGWSDVLRALQSDDARATALSRYRAAGYSPDDFGRLRSARGAMADALVAAEDAIELERRTDARDRERAAIRSVRRVLELELWP